MALPEPPPCLLGEWTAEQARVAGEVLDHDDKLTFVLDPATNLPTRESPPLICCGCDVSFSVDSPSDAVVTLAAVHLRTDGTMRAVYSASRKVVVTVPYAPTYLAFREAPFVEEMVDAAPAELRERISVLLTDGNGVLHPRGAGLACHVGIRLALPTVGVGKTLMCVDGLLEKGVREGVKRNVRGDAYPLVGSSGRVWGNAVLTGNAVSKPLFVSCGHRVGLDTATRLVKALCTFRVPEPIRLADLHSRQALRGLFVSIPFEADSLSA
jgi:endonuclease V